MEGPELRAPNSSTRSLAAVFSLISRKFRNNPSITPVLFRGISSKIEFDELVLFLIKYYAMMTSM